MRIGLLGGTGKEGRGLALRWARAGHHVVLGSRDAQRAASVATELAARAGGTIDGGDNAAAAACDVVALCVPYAAHAETLKALADDLAGRIVVDLVVPIAPPDIGRVRLPPGGAAALEAREILGPAARVVGALHHVSAVHLANLEHQLDDDVLVCGDDAAAKDVVIGLARDLGMRGVDAGPLANAIALESMTPVLLYMNKRYKRTGLGLAVTGLGGPGGPGDLVNPGGPGGSGVAS